MVDVKKEDLEFWGLPRPERQPVPEPAQDTSTMSEESFAVELDRLRKNVAALSDEVAELRGRLFSQLQLDPEAST